MISRLKLKKEFHHTDSKIEIEDKEKNIKHTEFSETIFKIFKL